MRITAHEQTTCTKWKTTAMRLATLANGTRDGQLVLVSRDHTHVVAPTGIVATLQEALERWEQIESQLLTLASALEAGTTTNAVAFSIQAVMAPLPRAWQWLDGSAFESHGNLMSKVFGMDPPPRDRPLMYQGVSDHFYGPRDDIPLPSEEDGIDFEGEFGVITDRVPMGVDAARARDHIKLVVQINDWSLRTIAPIEMKTGFGWVQAKPPCSMAPIAVTPDELGASWRNDRVDLPLEVYWNAQKFGAANGYAMAFSFPELIAHAARTRSLVQGTIIGSGTVSNENFRQIGSSCIAERRGIEILDEGAARTGYMKFGDTVRMEARGADGAPLFGEIAQRVVKG
jgi:fumarylacetoacetate (FAA) hydrolase